MKLKSQKNIKKKILKNEEEKSLKKGHKLKKNRFS